MLNYQTDTFWSLVVELLFCCGRYQDVAISGSRSQNQIDLPNLCWLIHNPPTIHPWRESLPKSDHLLLDKLYTSLTWKDFVHLGDSYPQKNHSRVFWLIQWSTIKWLGNSTIVDHYWINQLSTINHSSSLGPPLNISDDLWIRYRFSAAMAPRSPRPPPVRHLQHLYGMGWKTRRKERSWHKMNLLQASPGRWESIIIKIPPPKKTTYIYIYTYNYIHTYNIHMFFPMWLFWWISPDWIIIIHHRGPGLRHHPRASSVLDVATAWLTKRDMMH